MVKQLKQYLLGEKEKPAQTERILGRHLARELTPEELEVVAGGCDPRYCIPSTPPSGGCDCYA